MENRWKVRSLVRRSSYKQRKMIIKKQTAKETDSCSRESRKRFSVKIKIVASLSANLERIRKLREKKKRKWRNRGPVCPKRKMVVRTGASRLRRPWRERRGRRVGEEGSVGEERTRGE